MTNKTHKVDRTNWPAGEWDNEPDRIDFVHDGFSCMMIRAHGHWCGYVGVPDTHPMYEKDDGDINIDVHGGITYTAKCDDSGIICHVPAPGMTDDVWWLGFDCHHFMDESPAMLALHTEMGFSHDKDSTYKNVEYVKSEIRSMIDQLKDM